MERKYYLYVGKEKVEVTEEAYKSYWQEREHEKYLRKVDRKVHLLFFSDVDHDGNFVDNLIDERVNVEEEVSKQIMIEDMMRAISKLTNEEKSLIQKLYFEEKTLRATAQELGIEGSTVMRRRNKIFKKIREMMGYEN